MGTNSSRTDFSFKFGDIVQFKSGSPPLTVVKDYDPEDGGLVECMWFSGSRKTKHSFSPVLLAHVDLPAPQEPPEKEETFSRTPGQRYILDESNRVITSDTRDGIVVCYGPDKTDSGWMWWDGTSRWICKIPEIQNLLIQIADPTNGGTAHARNAAKLILEYVRGLNGI